MQASVAWPLHCFPQHLILTWAAPDPGPADRADPTEQSSGLRCHAGLESLIPVPVAVFAAEHQRRNPASGYVAFHELEQLSGLAPNGFASILTQACSFAACYECSFAACREDDRWAHTTPCGRSVRGDSDARRRPGAQKAQDVGKGLAASRKEAHGQRGQAQ